MFFQVYIKEKYKIKKLCSKLPFRIVVTVKTEGQLLISSNYPAYHFIPSRSDLKHRSGH